jgi:hypothetical protein
MRRMQTFPNPGQAVEKKMVPVTIIIMMTMQMQTLWMCVRVRRWRMTTRTLQVAPATAAEAVQSRRELS